jgi:hypothetical protein
MATVEQLERIARLSAALAPLTGKQRGMRIEADDWNTLVGAVKGILEVDRAQEEGASGSLADAYATRVHEHLGTVSVAWLASDLQARVGEAGGGVSLLAALNDVRRRLEAGLAEVARLTAAVEDVQRRLDRGSVEEVDRTNRLRAYEDRLTGIEDLKVTVGGVTGIVDQLKPRIDDVLALQGTLTDPQGNPIDIPAIQSQIKDLQTLRESLVGVTGETLRLQDFETQLTDLKNQLRQTTGGGIDERFGGLATDLEARFDRRLDEQATTLRTTLTKEIGEVRADTQQQVLQAFDTAQITLNQSIGTRVEEVESRIKATLDAREQALVTGLRTEIVATTKAQIDATVPGIVQAGITAQEGRLGTIIDTRLNERLTNVILPPILRGRDAASPEPGAAGKPRKASAAAKPSKSTAPKQRAAPARPTRPQARRSGKPPKAG